MSVQQGVFAIRGLSLVVLACLAVFPGINLRAQNAIAIDATAAVPQPQPVTAHLGTNHNPKGDVLTVNSQYLAMNGKPWIPVMGEFHFSRYPEARWEQEILKMKTAGVDIISTYVIWIHHEQQEGVFDWEGQRNLRRFVELCGRHGMYVYPRIGPWAHAETRNGGLPDWVLKNGPVRQNDPVYLREVATFYKQIAAQLRGQLWKDGGPVIGIQIENEYSASGPGKGAEHIRTLKRMAVEDGMDVPLYTVTGWDGAAIPLDEVLPVFGGYPDAPWDGSAKALPPNEVYAFRFANRAAGSMGAIGGKGQNPASTYAGTPFFTAEIGDGIEDTYFRRPVVSADDVAAIAPVMLGSGVNLLGYYMFHGGRNPEGGAITLQESQRSGYPTDVPVKSYDFQAPLGEFGQERESLRKLKLVHYFLADFGAELAPMATRVPVPLLSGPTDLSVPRVAARTRGDAGFVFFNNHVRGAQARSFNGFQVELKLPSGTIMVPNEPIQMVSGAYGIWPVDLQLGATTLRYSTAQLFKRTIANGRTYYFFFVIPGIAPEFAFGSGTEVELTTKSSQMQNTAEGRLVRVSATLQSELRLAGGISIVTLPEGDAERIWRGDDASSLLSTGADAFADGSNWTLQSVENPDFDFGIFGATKMPTAGGVSLSAAVDAGSLFKRYRAAVPAVHLDARLTRIQAAGARPLWQMAPAPAWRPEPVPYAPEDADFAKAAAWKVEVPAMPASASLSDAFLRIRYQGDAARLYLGETLVDDNFWNGLPWEIGLRETAAAWPEPAVTFQLRILGLPQKYPMYLEDATSVQISRGAAAGLMGVEILPQYQLQLEVPRSK